jgi:hypothetical protein
MVHLLSYLTPSPTKNPLKSISASVYNAIKNCNFPQCCRLHSNRSYVFNMILNCPYFPRKHIGSRSLCCHVVHCESIFFKSDVSRRPQYFSVVFSWNRCELNDHWSILGSDISVHWNMYCLSGGEIVLNQYFTNVAVCIIPCI